jgi:TetR/AcrR family transcriptional regulator, regulator of mycofactocin system
MTTKQTPGRPRTTSRHEVQRVALRLFAERGFEETTLDDIAAAVGVSRRTLFRYYPSKNDIVWGEFSEHLAGLRERLAAAPAGEPLMEVLRRAVVAFNDYGARELPELRIRMSLITSVPALQGHSMLRYQDWCDVIAEFVAVRLGRQPDDHLPQVIANAALGTAMATYRHWITHPEADLLMGLDEAFRLLAAGFEERSLGAGRA